MDSVELPGLSVRWLYGPAFLIACGLAWWLTGVVRTALLRIRLVDVPNERSSHTVETPRGGGIAVLAASAPFALLALFAGGDQVATATVMGAVAAMGLLGWIEDRYRLPAPLRLAAQTAVAVALMGMLGAPRTFEIGPLALDAGPFAVLAGVLWFVWLTNLYNFMDGIDGIAGAQGAVATAFIGMWMAARGQTGLALLCFSLAGACVGFLRWNWQPARIFLGDAGSLALGAAIAALALAGTVRAQVPLDAFAILLALFIADATVTVLQRALRGARLMEAHREHFYQRAVRAGLRHATVAGWTAAVGVLMGVAATLEALRVPPRGAWLAIGVGVPCVLAMLVKHKENRV